MLIAFACAVAPACRRDFEAWRDDLHDPDALVRRLAVVELTGWDGPPAGDVIAALAPLLDDADVDVRKAALDGLVAQGSSVVPTLLRDLVAGGLPAAARGQRLEVLRRLDGAAASALADASTELGVESQGSLAGVLGELGARGEPGLQALMASASHEVRCAAVAAIGQLPDPSEALLATLDARLRDVPSVARAALLVLGSRPVLHDGSLAEILVIAADEDSVRGAAQALVPRARAVAAAELLRRSAAGDAEASGWLAAHADTIESYVAAALLDLRAEVSAAARAWLVRRGARAAVSVARVVNWRQPRVLELVGATLREIGGDCVPLLVSELEDQDVTRRVQAAGALGTLGPGLARPAVPALVTMLDGKDVTLRVVAATALASIGLDRRDEDSLERLVQEATTGHFALRVFAAQAVTPLLVERFLQGPPARRREAAEVLVALGPLAASGRERLAASLAQSDPGSAGETRTILRAISSEP